MRKKMLGILFMGAVLLSAIGITGAYASGATDYATYCQGCHGPLASSNVSGTTVGSVRAAVTKFGMGGTMFLSDAQIQAILDAIHGTSTPVTCTGYAYSAWLACVNGQQMRTVTGNTPAGCTGTPTAAPVLTQACSSTPVACTSFTYSAWSACQPNNSQSRTLVSSSPAGCTGAPPASELTQTCSFVPPPVGQTMPVPTSERAFSFDAVELPVASSDPAAAKPIGVGPIATGGHTFDVAVNVGPFAGPVNVSFTIYAPALDFADLYFMTGDGLKLLSQLTTAGRQSVMSKRDSSEGSDGGNSSGNLNLVVWKSNVTGVNERISTTPVTDLPSGMYTLVLVAESPTDDHSSYRWITHVSIP